LHRWKGQEGPFALPGLRSAALRLAVGPPVRPRQRKSRRAVTRDVLDCLLATCSIRPARRHRDLAILLLAFASGGRRSEWRGCGSSSSATNRLYHLIRAIRSPTLHCRRSSSAHQDRQCRRRGEVFLVGPPVEALREAAAARRHRQGPIFRAIDRWEAIEERALTPQSISLIVKLALRAGRIEAGICRARPEIGVPDGRRAGACRCPGDAAVAAPVGAAGGDYYNEAERSLGRQFDWLFDV
jgi:hypothetical protein